MSLASTLGKYTGIALAEIVWATKVAYQQGPKFVVGFYTVAYSADHLDRLVDRTTDAIVSVSKKHAIDSTNPTVVSDNLWNCLEYLD